MLANADLLAQSRRSEQMQNQTQNQSCRISCTSTSTRSSTDNSRRCTMSEQELKACRSFVTKTSTVIVASFDAGLDDDSVREALKTCVMDASRFAEGKEADLLNSGSGSAIPGF